MDSKFGFFVNKAKGVVFDGIEIYHGDSTTNPNHPEHIKSPNAPRADFRLEGYANPVLGDEGRGQIQRWGKLNLDALESMIEQMIEHYLKDEDFYKRTLCREALWNLYRRMAWWVKNQTDPQKTQWNNALALIKDCIYKILKDAELVDGEHEGIELPLCPAPYPFTYSSDFYDNFNNTIDEIETLNTSKQAPWEKLHGIFRYMSSSEDIRWDIDPSQVNVIRFNVNNLNEGDSSKMGFNWRFKKKGYIKFSYMVTSSRGNGVIFFINGKQVGGEWYGENNWKTVQYNLNDAQTFRFEWLVRNMAGKERTSAYIYIKDIICVEQIVPLWAVPKNTDVAWKIQRYDGTARASFSGTNSSTSPELILPITLDKDGELSFNVFELKTKELVDIQDEVENISDSFAGKIFKDTTWNGSSVDIDHGIWSVNGSRASIQKSGKIISTIGVKPNTSVEITGNLVMTCPAPNSIPLDFEETKIKTFSDFLWTPEGATAESFPIKVSGGKLVIEPSTPNGEYSISTQFTTTDSGYITIKHNQTLLDGDSIVVLINSEVVETYESPITLSEISFPIEVGNQKVTIKYVKTSGVTSQVNENLTDTKVLAYTDLKPDFDAMSAKYTSSNSSKVQHQRYLTDIKYPNTLVNKDEVTYTINLAPNSSAVFSESVDIAQEPSSPLTNTVFHETFTGGKITTGLTRSANWLFESSTTLFGEFIKSPEKDVIYVKKTGSVNSITKPVFSLSSGGNLTFKYGGSLTKTDKLELFVTNNGKRKLVWTGNTSTQSSDKPNSISVGLLKGTNELEWIYTDTEEEKDVCFTSGGQKILVNYFDNKEVKTKRGLKHWWRQEGGQNNKSSFYTEKEVVNENTEYSTRRFVSDFPEFSTVTYEENLTIYRGSKTVPKYNQVDGDVEIKIQENLIDSRYEEYKNETLNYYYLEAGVPITKTQVISDDRKTNLVTNKFYADGNTEISFDYECLLYDFSGDVRDSERQKAKVFISLIGEDGTRYTLISLTNNSTTKTRVSSNLDGTWGGKYKQTVNVDIPGTYYFEINFIDTISDKDTARFSPEGDLVPRFFAIKNLVINPRKVQVGTQKVYDNTRVKMSVRKQGNNTVLYTYTFDVYPEDKEKEEIYVSVNFSDYVKTYGAGTYYVEYELLDRDYTTGGLKGTGGGFALYGGFVEEKYPAYCVDSNGKEYLKGTKLPKNSWIYLDDIKVTETVYVAPPPNYNFSVFLSGAKIKEIKTEADTDINIPLTNTTNALKTFTIRYKFTTPNKDKAVNSDAKIVFSQNKTTNPSSAEIVLFDLYKKVRLFGGGCGTSSMKAILYDGTNNIVSTHIVTPNTANNTFTFNIPSSSVYSNNRLEIVSEMNSEYRLRQTFLVNDLNFKVTQPKTSDYFSSSLQLYVDGELKDFYQTNGTKTFPISKGTHEIKWVFKRNNFKITNDDYVILDWVRVTNWLSETITVVPYCDAGGGEKCVEALIRCLLELWKNRPTGVVIGNKIWLFT